MPTDRTPRRVLNRNREFPGHALLRAGEPIGDLRLSRACALGKAFLAACGIDGPLKGGAGCLFHTRTILICQLIATDLSVSFLFQISVTF